MNGLYFEQKQVNGVVGKNLNAYPFFMPYATEVDISLKSLRVYLNRFTQFIRFLNEKHDICIASLEGFEKVDSDLLKEFIQNEQDSQSTKKSKYYALNSLYGYLQEKEYVDSNPLQEIEVPKVKSEINTNYLTEKEIIKICRHLEKEISNATTLKQRSIYRDLAMFSLALSTGLRPSNIVNLKRSDYKNGYLYLENIRIKVNKQTMKRLEKWLEFNNQEMLFVNSRNKAMSVRQFEKVLDSYESIIHRKVNPQLLRATYAHGALQRNISSVEIAKQMGITPVTLVSRYLETNT